MDGLALKQKRLRDQIERALPNFKKIGLSNLTAAKVRNRIAALSDAWKDFQHEHDQLVLATTAEEQDTHPYFTENHLHLVEDAYNEARDYMSDCLEDLEPPASPHPSVLDASTYHSPSTAHTVPLPPIRLTPFTGKYADWCSFRDSFTALVRKNKDLSNFARMHYLLSNLSHSALECINHLSPTAANFEPAWALLVARFEDKNRLLDTILSSLISLPVVTRENAADLRTLYDKFKGIVASLSNLDRTPAQLWDDTLVHLLSNRFDPVTQKAWALQATSPDDAPSFKELETFFLTRVRALERVDRASPQTRSKPATSRVHMATIDVSSQEGVCPVCSEPHSLRACARYKSLSPVERREIVRRHNRCYNCLSSRHAVTDCPSMNVCRICRKRHHSTLHLNSGSGPSRGNSRAPVPPAPVGAESTPRTDSTVHHATVSSRPRRAMILASAYVMVRVPGGRHAVVRALIDQGAEMTFISENLAQMLRVKRIRMPISFNAIDGFPAGASTHAAHIIVSHRARFGPSFDTYACIRRSMTTYVPTPSPTLDKFEHLSSLEWADPDPTASTPFDIIIGCDLYNDVILHGVRKGNPGEPLSQESIFGWIICGPRESYLRFAPGGRIPRTTRTKTNSVSVLHCCATSSLDDAIQQFWKLEDVPTSHYLEPSDSQAESHFRRTHFRDASGRYVVRLPFKTGPPINIGHSRNIATKLAHRISRQLHSDPTLQKEYHKFMREYESLGHMRTVASVTSRDASTVYIPHHPVLRTDVSPNRLRVVFNASCRTSNGSTLNDFLLTGPKLQTDLSAITLSDPIPPPLLQDWTAISSRFRALNSLKIPRWTHYSADARSVQIHGFADASNSAYAAVVYLRLHTATDDVVVSLLTGKSKVAPLHPVTIPRLELSAAVLLSRLIAFVIDALDCRDIPVFCWSDSTVVLHWLSHHPSRWKMFVANRVATIQSRIPSATWRYTPSQENPADCASRGLFADELLSHSLWWRGPDWLCREVTSWPDNPPGLISALDLEQKATVLQCTVSPEPWELASRFSSWPRLIRVTAYIMRFVDRCRRRSPGSSALSGRALTAEECCAARNFWLRRIQRDLFPSEVQVLTRAGTLDSKSPLLALRPFIDSDQLVRVGGRLQHAPSPYAMRCPVVLASHPLVLLMVTQAHHRALHGGPQSTLSLLRRDFWILRARALVRRVVRNCITCVRERAAVPSQLMGSFPLANWTHWQAVSLANLGFGHLSTAGVII